MKINLVDGGTVQDSLENWPLPAFPSYVESTELAWLARDLRRYSLGRVLGRSYLIAGHRGAGKSALVTRAVDLTATEIMRNSVVVGSALGDASFQRPLLVKLHGPSMLQDQAGQAVTQGASAAQQNPAPSSPSQGQPTGPTSTANAAAAGSSVGQPTDGSRSSASTVPAPAPGVPAALVQMTIGLYRALAMEVGVGYRAHALSRRADLKDGEEMAAQLALDLDLGASPSDLNRYWSAIGRLSGGVLWPRSADETLSSSGVTDQGLREIAALATAGQAYQVCTGRVSYGTTLKDASSRSSSAEGAGSSDVKDGLTRLATLGVGALSGAAVLPSAGGIAGLATGIAVWLLGSATVKWSWSTKRSGDRSSDYSFIRNMEPTTLDRELPIVIARVRQAGVAPVFAIDELDKVDNAAELLIDLIGRLKHLIADYGFFCFLVNRDCFEAIEAKVRKAAYPAEHTLFSERLLLRPDSGLTFKYLMDRTVGQPEDGQATFARTVFALCVMHASRLNLTDVMRQLARHTRTDGSIGDSAEWVTQRRLVAATVQLAIDETLREPSLLERMNSDPTFGQLALDAVYYPSRQWQAGLEVDASREALRRHLEDRRANGKAAGALAAVDDENLRVLHRHMLCVLRWLSNLEAFRSILDRKLVGDEAVDQPGDVRAADVIPAGVAAICLDRGGGVFEFLVGRDGDALSVQAGEMTDPQRRTATTALTYARQFLDLLEQFGVPLDDLASTPLFSAIYRDAVERAAKGVTDALALNAFDEKVAEHLATLERLRAEVSRNGERLGLLLIVAASAARDAGSGTRTLRRIQRLLRYDEEPTDWFDGPRLPLNLRIPTDPAALAAWRESTEKRLLPAIGDAGLEENDYQSLATSLQSYLTIGSPRRLKPRYGMLVRAAAGRLPASVLSADLAAMRVGDWSTLAVAAMPKINGPASAPYWVLVASLRALGFGRTALVSLADDELADALRETNWLVDEASFQIAGEIASSAPDAPPGILIVDTQEQNAASERPSPRRAVLAIHEDQIDGVGEALQWLEALGIFAGVTDARPEN